MHNLTKRQAEALDLIERREIPPTLRELGVIMGIASTNGVNDHLSALRRKGRLDGDAMKSRSWRVTKPLSEEERRLYGLPSLSRCTCCGQRIAEKPTEVEAESGPGYGASGNELAEVS
jgi:SOS-response transcriptional repressor LexA